VKTSKILEQITVTVELDPSLERFSDPERMEGRDLRTYLSRYLDDLAEDLMIPVEISLNISLGKDKDKFSTNSFQANINNQKCKIPLPTLIPQHVQTLELARSIAKEVYENRELIITAPLSEKIRENWSSKYQKDSLNNFSAKEFQEFLSALVRRGFSINRAEEFIKASKNKQSEWNAEKCFEEAISGIDTTTITVFLSDTQYERMVYPDQEEEEETQAIGDEEPIEKMFSMMQDGLYYELGLIIPKVRIDTDNSLEENGFRIQLNDLRFPPLKGLKQDQFLVNEIPERLYLLNLEAEGAINPANQSESAIVQNKENTLKICEKAGLTTWNPQGFIVLALSAAIRKNASSFLTKETVKYNTNTLQTPFPQLIKTIITRFDIIDLTRILRDLLDEEISIRNLRAILEALLEINTPTDPNQNDYNLSIPETVSLLRISLKRYITNKYVISGNTLVVYLIDHQIETRINSDDELSEEERDQLIRAIYDQAGSFVEGKDPIILTTIETRKKLKKLTEKEFPRLIVLCYEELATDLNINPIGRISWS
jgi:type III secretory pathway component EscV